jgi:hypothetical protein
MKIITTMYRAKLVPDNEDLKVELIEKVEGQCTTDDSPETEIIILANRVAEFNKKAYGLAKAIHKPEDGTFTISIQTVVE